MTPTHTSHDLARTEDGFGFKCADCGERRLSKHEFDRIPCTD